MNPFFSIFLLFSVLTDFQNESFSAEIIQETYHKRIAFGTALDISSLDTASIWEIKQGNTIIASGKGVALNAYLFQEPGAYVVNILTPHENHPGGCNHADYQQIIELLVEPVRLEWNWDESFWFQLFKNGKSFINMEIKLPISMYTYNNQSQVVSGELNIRAAGVDCTFTGHFSFPENFQVLGNQKYDLPFVLNGSVKSGIYFMLDFINYTNQVDSYPITKVIP